MTPFSTIFPTKKVNIDKIYSVKMISAENAFTYIIFYLNPVEFGAIFGAVLLGPF